MPAIPQPWSVRRNQLLSIMRRNPKFTQAQLRAAMLKEHGVQVESSRIREVWGEFNNAPVKGSTAEESMTPRPVRPSSTVLRHPPSRIVEPEPEVEESEPAPEPGLEVEPAPVVEPSQDESLVPETLLASIESIHDAVKAAGGYDNALLVAQVVAKVNGLQNFERAIRLLRAINPTYKPSPPTANKLFGDDPSRESRESARPDEYRPSLTKQG